MSRSDVTVLPQLFAEYMALSIYYIQDEIEDRTTDLLKTRNKRVTSLFCIKVGAHKRERWRNGKHTDGIQRYPEN